MWVLVIYRWEGLEKYLCNGILHVLVGLKSQSQNEKRKIFNRSVTADQGGQKNRNGKTTAVLFRIVSLLVLVETSELLTHGLTRI